jgi:hypothetical protein
MVDEESMVRVLEVTAHSYANSNVAHNEGAGVPTEE